MCVISEEKLFVQCTGFRWLFLKRRRGNVKHSGKGRISRSGPRSMDERNTVVYHELEAKLSGQRMARSLVFYVICGDWSLSWGRWVLFGVVSFGEGGGREGL